MFAGFCARGRTPPRVGCAGTVPDWEAEGLLEGLDDDERRERAELLDYLHDEVGVPLDRLRDQDPALLIAMPAERHVGGEPRHTPRECAEAAGIDLELAERLRRAMGLPVVAPDERTLGDADMQSIKLAAGFLQAGMPEEDMLAVTRVLGRGLGQAAAVMRQVAMRMALEPGLSERELAERFDGMAGTLTPATLPIMEQTLKLHLRQMLSGRGRARRRAPRRLAARRARGRGRLRRPRGLHAPGRGRAARRARRDRQPAGGPRGRRHRPARADRQDDRRRRDVRQRGPRRAAGRLDHPRARRPRPQGEDFPQLRIGAAAGQAINRAGDWFGRPVNLASRVTGIARPGSVVCTEAVKQAAPGRRVPVQLHRRAQDQGRARLNRSLPGAQERGRRGRRGTRALTRRRPPTSGAASCGGRAPG